MKQFYGVAAQQSDAAGFKDGSSNTAHTLAIFIAEIIHFLQGIFTRRFVIGAGMILGSSAAARNMIRRKSITVQTLSSVIVAAALSTTASEAWGQLGGFTQLHCTGGVGAPSIALRILPEDIELANTNFGNISQNIYGIVEGTDGSFATGTGTVSGSVEESTGPTGNNINVNLVAQPTVNLFSHPGDGASWDCTTACGVTFPTNSIVGGMEATWSGFNTYVSTNSNGITATTNGVGYVDLGVGGQLLSGTEYSGTGIFGAAVQGVDSPACIIQNFLNASIDGKQATSYTMSVNLDSLTVHAFKPVKPVFVGSSGPAIFDGTATGSWCDTSICQDQQFETVDGSLFTNIDNLPGGFSNAFSISVDGISIGEFSPGQTVDFADYASILGAALEGGTGVAAFTISGVTPVASGEENFPIQLEFNQPSVSFIDLPVTAVPEPTSLSLLALGSLGLLRRRRRINTTCHREPRNVAALTARNRSSIGNRLSLAGSMPNAVVFGLVAFTLLAACESSSRAALIVADDFSGSTNGANLNTVTPDLADLPGITYYVWHQGGSDVPSIDTSVGNPAASASTGYNALASINIASSGSYVLPNTLTISADIQMGSIASGGDLFRGIGLGFFSQAAGGGDASSYFTGLTVNSDGTLRLVTPGGGDNYGVGSTTFFAAPFAGFSTSAYYNLSYTVNTSTGTITSVIFDGNNDTSDFTGATEAGFESSSSSATVLAGFYASSGLVGSTGHLDNLSIANAVPEPASLSLLAIGSLGLLRRRRRMNSIHDRKLPQLFCLH